MNLNTQFKTKDMLWKSDILSRIKKQKKFRSGKTLPEDKVIFISKAGGIQKLGNIILLIQGW